MILLSGHKVEHCRVEDVATSEGSSGRSSEGHRPVELISSQPPDDFPVPVTARKSRGVEDK